MPVLGLELRPWHSFFLLLLLPAGGLWKSQDLMLMIDGRAGSQQLWVWWPFNFLTFRGLWEYLITQLPVLSVEGALPSQRSSPICKRQPRNAPLGYSCIYSKQWGGGSGTGFCLWGGQYTLRLVNVCRYMQCVIRVIDSVFIKRIVSLSNSFNTVIIAAGAHQN